MGDHTVSDVQLKLEGKVDLNLIANKDDKEIEEEKPKPKKKDSNDDSDFDSDDSLTTEDLEKEEEEKGEEEEEEEVEELLISPFRKASASCSTAALWGRQVRKVSVLQNHM